MVCSRTIDLFIAAYMRPAEDLERRLRGGGVTKEALEEVRRVTELGGLGNALKVEREDVIRCFGPADSSAAHTLVYNLELWPDHEFIWVGGIRELVEFDPVQQDRVIESIPLGELWVPRGFALRRAPMRPSWIPLNLRAALDTFQPWYDTATDVEGVLGKASLVDGWGKDVEFRYGPLDGGDDLIFDFDFGLLREITTRELRIQRLKDNSQE